MLGIAVCTQTFVQATVEVLQDLLEQKLHPTPIETVDSPVAVLEVAVIVGITGNLEGRVLFEFSSRTALEIASVMNFGERFDEFNSMVRSTLSELGNLIAGRAVTLLNDSGADLHISPPILMCGLGMRSSDESPVKRFTVPTPCGDACVNLSTRPTERRITKLSHYNGASAKA